jgi:hypothetical protein
LPGLLCEIDEHGSRLKKHASRLAGLLIRQRRDFIVGRDHQKVWRELLALCDIDEVHGVGDTDLLEHDRRLRPVRRRPGVEFNHGSLPVGPPARGAPTAECPSPRSALVRTAEGCRPILEFPIWLVRGGCGPVDDHPRNLVLTAAKEPFLIVMKTMPGVLTRRLAAFTATDAGSDGLLWLPRDGAPLAVESALLRLASPSRVAAAA